MNEKLCLMPWAHLATLSSGDVKLCCIAKNDSKLNLNKDSIVKVWNSDYYKASRKSMLAGEQISTCDVCWKEENLGIESHRIIANRGYVKKAGIDAIEKMLESTEPDGHLEMLPPTLDLRLGNTCNLECMMCHPNDSSKWVKRSYYLAENLETEIKFQWKYKSEINTDNYDWYKSEQFWEDFQTIAPNLNYITFGGGEPLYVKEQKKIIKYLVENGYAGNIEMLYHTNGTIYDEEVVELWKNFGRVKVMLSIDGHDDVNSYIRRPSDWKTIETNLRLYDKTPPNIIVSINTTVQLLNIVWLTEFVEWLLDQKFDKVGKGSDGGIFFASLLHYPPYLSVQTLPSELKDIASEKIHKLLVNNPNNNGIQRLRSVVEFMNASDQSSLLNQTLDFIDANDKKDGLSFKLREHLVK
jgi:MoaA/NifB/PqqE/SkfB family radical SAM enzyme